jgi:hypothetical protein
VSTGDITPRNSAGPERIRLAGRAKADCLLQSETESRDSRMPAAAVAEGDCLQRSHPKSRRSSRTCLAGILSPERSRDMSPDPG